MGRFILLVGSVLLLVGGGFGAVWEFGNDCRKSVVVATSSGDISIFQKTKRIQFTVPTCHEVVYVRVEVENELTTPAVNYVKDTNTITIHYKLLQSSFSYYNVIVKAVPLKHCGRTKRGKNQPRKYQSIESEEDYDFDEMDYRSSRPLSQKHSKYNEDVQDDAVVEDRG